MRDTSDKTTGQGLLFGALVCLALALWMSLGRQQWIESALWYTLAVFLACYGAMMAGADERWHRPLLIVGLLTGIVAFGLALRMVGLLPF